MTDRIRIGQVRAIPAKGELDANGETLMAILAVFFVYLGVSRIWSRRKGLLAAFVMATCPQFFMISRQAQTDMPLVGCIVIALIFLMLAFFAPRAIPGVEVVENGVLRAACCRERRHFCTIIHGVY